MALWFVTGKCCLVTGSYYFASYISLPVVVALYWLGWYVALDNYTPLFGFGCPWNFEPILVLHFLYCCFGLLPLCWFLTLIGAILFWPSKLLIHS
jgi:hypothetical protein